MVWRSVANIRKIEAITIHIAKNASALRAFLSRDKFWAMLVHMKKIITALKATKEYRDTRPRNARFRTSFRITFKLLKMTPTRLV